MNLFTKQTQRHRKQTYAAKGQVGGVTNQEVWNKNIHTTIISRAGFQKFNNSDGLEKKLKNDN